MKIKFGDVITALKHVDDPDAAERAKTEPAMRMALDMSRPPNWQGTGMNDALLLIARDEGISLAWIPRPEIVKEIGAAPDASARQQVLTARHDDILDDCRDALSQCKDASLSDQTAIAGKALSAVADGHHEAGMALAVSLGEPLAAWASTPRVRMHDSPEARDQWEAARKKSKYKWASIEIDAVGTDITPYVFKYQVLTAPIPSFFTPFHPGTGGPAPESLSRHVVAHQPTLTHLTALNSLKAVMLVTAILREMQDWAEEMTGMEEYD